MPELYSLTEWRVRYSRLRDMADRIAKMRNDRARALCAAAGLDPNLLGIHPHNAMCDFRAGYPWREVNYSLCRACIRVLRSEFEPYDVVTRWDRRVRCL